MKAPVVTRLQVVVVPHTHWDREWYLPFERFRMRLVRMIDHLLGIFDLDPSYSHFMLDGQTIVLEDYLAIRGDRFDRLHELIAGGRIAVGPWYVLPDEFLVSGEAMVRNLQVGLAIAARFGGGMRIGYLPDSFGHVAQMPQILAGFGFESACLWRGTGEGVPGLEWRWEAPDGSSVYLQWLSGGYGNFAELPTDLPEAIARLKAELTRLETLGTSGVRLLMNGSDHLWPQDHLPTLLRAFRDHFPDYDVVQGSLGEAIDRARACVGDLAVVRGELREAAETSLLPGVLSARTYLKIRNAEAQTLIERYAEPLSALAWVRGREYPTEFLLHAWKTLLQNHPHDSICGCSIDPVHQEMLTRFAQVRQVGEALVNEACSWLEGGGDPEADRPRQVGVRAYNPHPWVVRAAIEGELVLDCAPDENPEFGLEMAHGELVNTEILAITRGVRVVNQSPAKSYNLPVSRVRARWIAELPPLGYREFRLLNEAIVVGVVHSISGEGRVIENSFYTVSALAGGVEIRDKATGEVTVHFFEDVLDRGDEYNFCPVAGDAPRTTQGLAWDRCEASAWGGTARLHLTLRWPMHESLSADRSRGRRSGHVSLDLTICLHHGVPRVDFNLLLDNRAQDHRVRAAFRTAGPIAHTHADTAFGWCFRSAEVPERDWAEQPVGTFPMVSQVVVETASGMAGISAVGLHEHEAVSDTLYLTLVRAVGWLSRDDLSTRKGDAGPMLATPDAQCPGPLAVRYAWIGQGSADPPGTLERRSAEFTVPPIVTPLGEWVDFRSEAFVALDQPAWQFSSLKRSEDGQALIIRIFSGVPVMTSGTVTLGFPVSRVQTARIDETPLEDLVLAGEGAFAATLGPWAIGTFLIRLPVP